MPGAPFRKKLKQSDREEIYIFLVFLTQKGANLRLSRFAMISSFPTPPKTSVFLKRVVSINVRFGEGQMGSFQETYIDPQCFLQNVIFTKWNDTSYKY